MHVKHLTALKWYWWRLLNIKAFSRYDYSAAQPNLQLLHKILERVDPDTFEFLIKRGGYNRYFLSNHTNANILKNELIRRKKEVDLRTKLAPESINAVEIKVRNFFIGQEKVYIPYYSGYSILRTSTLALVSSIQTVLSETNETFLDNHYSRRSAKMLLSVERLLIAICH